VYSVHLDTKYYTAEVGCVLGVHPWRCGVHVCVCLVALPAPVVQCVCVCGGLTNGAPPPQVDVCVLPTAMFLRDAATHAELLEGVEALIAVVDAREVGSGMPVVVPCAWAHVWACTRGVSRGRRAASVTC
jgi:hypothetical protein